MTPESALPSMIIACPDCGSRFKVESSRVPAGGRRVRCGKCGHVWRVAADAGPVSADAGVRPTPESADAGGTPPDSAADTNPVADNSPDGQVRSLPPADDQGTDDVQEPAADRTGPTPGRPAGVAQAPESGVAAPGGAEQAGEVDAAVPADAAPPVSPPPHLLRTAATPAARQKLAEARRGRSRLRFLMVALLLMIVAAIAVSFVRGPVSLNDTLRMVPGPSPDRTGGDDVPIDENARGDAPE